MCDHAVVLGLGDEGHKIGVLDILQKPPLHALMVCGGMVLRKIISEVETGRGPEDVELILVHPVA